MTTWVMARVQKALTFSLLFFALCYAAGALLPVHAQTNQEQFREPDTRQEFQDWVLECFENQLPNPQCQLYQRVLFNGGQGVALVISLTAPEKQKSGGKIQLAVPLGVKINSGVFVVVDDGFRARYNIDRCTKQGCIVESGLSESVLNRLIKGSKATIDVTSETGKPFSIPLSLKGFKQAFEQLSS